MCDFAKNYFTVTGICLNRSTYNIDLKSDKMVREISLEFREKSGNFFKVLVGNLNNYIVSIYCHAGQDTCIAYNYINIKYLSITPI